MSEKEKKWTTIQRLKHFTLLDLRILLAGLLNFTSSIGYIRGFTVLVQPLKEHLHSTDKSVALIPSFLLLGLALAGLFIGYFIPKYGNRNLVLLSGVISMAGSFLFTYLIKLRFLIPAYVVMFLFIGIPEGFSLTCCFDANRKFGTKHVLGMTMTLQSAGVSVGAFILPPLYRIALTRTTSIISTCYLIAGCQKGFNIVAGVLLPRDSPSYFKRRNRKEQQRQQQLRQQRDELNTEVVLALTPIDGKLKEPIVERPKFYSKSLFLTPYYYTFLIGISLFLLGYFSTIPFIKSLLTAYQLTERQITIYLFLLGIIEICSRLIYAIFLVDAFNPINLLSMGFIGDGLGCFLLCVVIFFQTYLLKYKIIILYVGIFVYGFFNAGFGGVMNATLIKIVPAQQFAVGLGMYQLIMGFGNSLGPLLGGSIVDATRLISERNSTQFTENHTGEIYLYEDPYWSTFMFSCCFCMVPAGCVIILLKRWFPD